MGAVFEATDLELDRTVAVKVLAHRSDADSIRRFRNEAQSAARLNHDHIARVYRVGEHEGWDYIVFEFVNGENLRDLVQRVGPLPMDQVLQVIAHVATALAHASAQGVIHRDIKPSNILWTLDGRAKIVDMGLARLRMMESEGDHHTASGVTLGTFDYISPEQGKDPRTVDVRGDLYSLGCTVYYLLTGQPPFPDGTPLQKLLRHTGEMPVDPRVLRPDLPPELSFVIRKLLAKQPEQRYQSPQELYAELRTVADRLGVHLFSAAPQEAGEAPSRPALVPWLPWLVPVGLMLLVALALWLRDLAAPDVVFPEFPRAEPLKFTPTVDDAKASAQIKESLRPSFPGDLSR